MVMVEDDPGVVMLRSVGLLAHVEPLNASCQYHRRRERAARQHVGGTSPGNPLQTDQQRELALHRRGQSEGVAYEREHCRRRFRLPLVRAGVPVGRVRHDGAATRGYAAARNEIDPWRPKSAIGDIRGNHLVAVRRKDGRHGAVAAARLPDRAAEADVPQQCLSDPSRRGVEIPPLPLKARYVDCAMLRRLERSRPRPCDRLPLAIGKRQALLKGTYWGEDSGSIHTALTAPHYHRQSKTPPLYNSSPNLHAPGPNGGNVAKRAEKLGLI